MAERLFIPPLGLNRPHDPIELNPHREIVLDSALGWAAARLSGVLPEQFEEFAKIGVGLAATVGPNLDQRGLTMTAFQNVWLYGIDAPADGEAVTDQTAYAAAFGATRTMLEDPTATADNPFARALQDIALMMDDSQQFGHWAAQVEGYLDGVTREIAYLREGTTPSLEDFKDMRRRTSGVGIVLSLIAPARRITLPQDTWGKAAVTALTKPAVETIAYDNDVISYPHEAARNRAALNLITILQRAENCSIQEAVTEAVRMRDASETEFLRVFLSLHEDPGTHSAVLEYADSTKGWVNGYLQFAETDPRHRNN